MRIQTTFALTLGLAMGLSACSPRVPDSRDGVGFQDYQSYLREREAAAARGTAAFGAPLDAASIGVTPPAGGFSPEIAASAIDRATGVAPAPVPVMPAPGGTVFADAAAGTPVSGTRARGDAPVGIKTESGEMAGISDENDFTAVSQRESIESDKARIERNRAQYEVIQPTAVPERTGKSAPNIVEYALSATNEVGVRVYSRSAIRLTNPDAACARFASPDLAQEAFLAAGGPRRDPKGLDPDGDGYACSWDPRPFRNALR